METLLGTQMHWLTLLFIVLEFSLFTTQLFHFLNRPEDKQRLWYLILLGLLIKFNIANGLFPDPSLRLDMHVQILLADGFAYLMGAYIPFYFFKAYGLTQLRWHATRGVLLFILLPYLLFVAVYLANNQLIPDREWSVMVPAIYGIVILLVMLRAIILKYRETGKKRIFRCELAVWLAIIPWEVMVVFAFWPAPQWLRILLANLGWLTITFLQFHKAIKYYRFVHHNYKELTMEINWEDFMENCKRFGLTQRETEIAELRLKGMERQAVADKLFISLHTVKTHINHIYEKTESNSPEELFKSLTRPVR
jgi:DNA-binding CsgD family transcriptional regulator